MTLPLPVIRKRFLAPECVLFFGMAADLLLSDEFVWWVVLGGSGGLLGRGLGPRCPRLRGSRLRGPWLRRAGLRRLGGRCLGGGRLRSRCLGGRCLGGRNLGGSRLRSLLGLRLP